MIKFLPLIFILLWSSAFITTKPIVDYSDPFAALSFRFLIVAIGFYFFSLFSKQKFLVQSKNILPSISTGILFHGFYLGGVFYSISIGLPTGIAALIVTLQPVLTNALAGPILNEKVTLNKWLGVLLGFIGAALVIGFDIGKSLPTFGVVAVIISLSRSSYRNKSSNIFGFLWSIYYFNVFNKKKFSKQNCFCIFSNTSYFSYYGFYFFRRKFRYCRYIWIFNCNLRSLYCNKRKKLKFYFSLSLGNNSTKLQGL